MVHTNFLWIVIFRHGFGDCRKPLPETAALIEDIVYRQMVDIVSICRNMYRY